MIIIYGKDTYPSLQLSMGGDIIPVKASDTHMGILIGNSNEMEQCFIKTRAQKARIAFFRAQSLGSRSVPLTPQAMSSLYWSVSVPRMVHGLEILPLRPSSIDILEQAHCGMAKMAQGLPQQTANVGCLATLGWKSISGHIDYLKLMFLWRILSLSTNCIYKVVAVIRLWYHMYQQMEGHKHFGPLADILGVYEKYDLVDSIDAALRGQLMPMGQFKKLAMSRIKAKENEKFQISCMLYKSLSLFTKCMSHIDLWSWWKFVNGSCINSNKVRVICRLLFN